MARDLYELKNEDVLDTREIEERITELEELEEAEDDPAVEEYAAELEILRSFKEEAEGYTPDWAYGEGLIRDSYFQQYAQELAEETGAIGSDNQWPLYCIDWEWAARELQMDYTSVELDGVTFWTR